jgi:hypothetical protein
MRLRQWMIPGVLLLQAGVAAGAQYPIMEKGAQKVIQ